MCRCSGIVDGMSQVALIAEWRMPARPCPWVVRPVSGMSVWDDSAVAWDEAIRRDLEVALDEVAEQLTDMPGDDVVDQEDLAWSLDSGVEVEVEVQSDEPLILRLDASKGFFRQPSPHRIIRIDSQRSSFGAAVDTRSCRTWEAFASAHVWVVDGLAFALRRAGAG